MTKSLNDEQRELVAVGASVGAGCQPCVSHHLKAGAKAGLAGEQLLAAVTSAERVSAEAAVAIGDHARGRLGPDVTSPALLTRLEAALASLGAALGANDKTNIDRQLRAAADVGATRSQLEQAIETAHNVQENAARIHLREAERLLDAVATATGAAASGADHGEGCRGGAVSEVEESRDEKRVSVSRGDRSDEDCGCGSDDKTEETPTSTEVTEPASTTTGHTGGCGWTAAPPAAVGASGAMADCREMFERFMPAAAPATSGQAPTATAASSPCNKEASR